MSMSNNIGVPIIPVNRNSDFSARENIGMSIGQRIKETRLEIPLTQVELAQKVGIKQPSLSELEKGDSASSKYLPAIAAALGVSALWLQTGKGLKYPIKSITPKELQLVMAYREATDEGRTFIEMACASAPKRDRLE
jgi:transcriptional regulator with XRE-family HTH domain